MGEFLNSFQKGMDKDSSKSFRQKESYVDAKNFRVSSGDEEGNGILENIKGHFSNQDWEFPSIESYWTIDVDEIEFPVAATDLTVDTDEPNSFLINLEEANSEDVLLNDIKNKLENEGFVAVVNGSRITFYYPGFNVTSLSGTLTSEDGYQESSIDAISSVTPIGYCTLRDSLIVFSTSGNLDGQIWEITYERSNLSPTITLLYNALLNFSVDNPIYDEAIGRYETEDIQRVYWTDNSNPVRTVNIRDEDLLALDPNITGIVPSVELSKPKIDNIIEGGVLESGQYMYAYRLKNLGGVQTEFSRLSQAINVSSRPTTNQYIDFDGEAETNSGKSVKIIIENIDQSFDTLELMVAYKSDISQEYTLLLILEENIEGIDDFEYTHSGQELGSIEISLAEFLINSQSSIETAKTIATKDNRLFLGNIKEADFEIDIDTRTYRFPSQNNSTYDDDVGDPITYTRINNDDISESYDLKNPYNKDDERSDLSLLQQKFVALSDNRFGPGEFLGGTGKHLSYKFITRSINLDENDCYNETITEDPVNVFVEPESKPNSGTDDFHVHVSKNLENATINQGFPTAETFNMSFGGNESWNNYKNPLFDSMFRGYQRSEIYRFGIVFFNKKGNPSTVKWIGDIRMPDFYDRDSSTAADFNLTNNPSTGENLKGNILGLRFNIDFSDIPDTEKQKISGFSIVRMKRNVNDRTVLGQGIVTEVAKIKGKNNGLSKTFFFNMHRQAAQNVGVAGNPLWGAQFGKNDEIGAKENATDNGYTTFDRFRNIGQPPVSAEDISEIWNEDGTNAFDIYTDTTASKIINSLNNVVRLDVPQFNFEGYPSLTNLKLKPVSIRHQKRGKLLDDYPFGYPLSQNLDSFLRQDTDTVNRTKWRNVDTSRNLDVISAVKLYGENQVFGDRGEIIAGDSNSVLKFNVGLAPLNMNSIRDLTLPVLDSKIISLGTYFPLNTLDGVPPADNQPYYNASRPTGWDTLGDTATFEKKDPPDVFANFGSSDGNQTSLLLSLDDANIAGLGTGVNFLFDRASGIFNQSSPIKNVKNNSQTMRLVVNLCTELEKQYGGDSFVERTVNEYISCNHFYKIDGLNDPVFNSGGVMQEVWGGDTFVVLTDKTMSFPNFGQGLSAAGGGAPPSAGETAAWRFGPMLDGAGETYENTPGDFVRSSRTIMIPMESTVNTELREGEHFYINGISTVTSSSSNPINGANREDFEHNFVFSSDRLLRQYFVDPLNLLTQNKFDNRVVASEPKINGELSDLWTVFLTNNTIDVEGLYGPINKLTVLRDMMYYVQDNGFGRLNISPRTALTSTEGSEVELGEGAVLADFDYISTKYGSKHQRSVVTSGNSIYFFDVSKLKMFKFQGQGAQSMSDIKGMSSFFDKLEGQILDVNSNTSLYDNILGDGIGITGVYDYNHHEVLFTFYESLEKDPFTLVYDETINGFSSFYTFYPKMYIFDNNNVLSADPNNQNKLYIHNKAERGNFYGIVSPSSVDIEVVPFADRSKAFDNISFHTEISNEDINYLNDTISRIRFHNDYQNTDWVTPDQTPLTGNIRRKEREWQMAIPRNVVLDIVDADIFLDLIATQDRASTLFKERLRDKYLTVNMEFSNDNDRRILLHYLKTFFRLSHR
jgi:hypothetical protein